MIDHVALLPAYAAVGTAVLVFLIDLAVPGRRGPVLTFAVLGAVATGGLAWWTGQGGTRTSFCTAAGCSYVWEPLSALIGITVAATTLIVLALSVPALRSRQIPPGEYAFLLACSMTGGVVLGASRDLIILIIALETLTLPLYALVGLRRQVLASAQAAVTFFVVSVTSTAVTLLGAALLYGATGTVSLAGLHDALGQRDGLRSLPLVGVAVVLVLVGLAFKVAAVPFHAWAPSTYDGAPLPVAAYLSTASKLGGVIALILVAVVGLGPWLNVTGPALAVIAALTMTVGNLVALRQRRMVRLLAWSSVAQAGYLLAPLGVAALAAGRAGTVVGTAGRAVLAYTVFYIALELGAFGAVVALRGGSDGGDLADYAGAARQRPWVAGAFVLALAGLAGLPPSLAGLFAKVVVVRSLLAGSAGWLAIVLALNAVIGLAYYLRAAAALFGRSAAHDPADAGGAAGGGAAGALPVTAGSPAATTWPRPAWPVAVALGAVTIAALVLGFAPQMLLDAVGRAIG